MKTFKTHIFGQLNSFKNILALDQHLAQCAQLMGVGVTLRGGDRTILSFGAIKQFTYSTCHDKFGFPNGTFTGRT